MSTNRNKIVNKLRSSAGKRIAEKRGHHNLSKAGRHGANARTHESRVLGGKKSAETRGHENLSRAGRKGSNHLHTNKRNAPK